LIPYLPLISAFTIGLIGELFKPNELPLILKIIFVPFIFGGSIWNTTAIIVSVVTFIIAIYLRIVKKERNDKILFINLISILLLALTIIIHKDWIFYTFN
jgi:hypothetical protein